jgi:hypothetical protein
LFVGGEEVIAELSSSAGCVVGSAATVVVEFEMPTEVPFLMH